LIGSDSIECNPGDAGAISLFEILRSPHIQTTGGELTKNGEV
jgi:hypothetical protein